MIRLNNVLKEYNQRKIIEDCNLEIAKGEFVAITGESGSGKTTLLNIIGMIAPPDSGEIVICNQTNPNESSKKNLRKKEIGYLFQSYFLLDDYSVEKNLKISVDKKDYSSSKVSELLKEGNLPDKVLKNKVRQLSGGEQQRVALVRAMLKDFNILLADEPTGNLDEENKKVILDLMLKLKKRGKTIVCVTHDNDIAKSADRIISL